MARYSTFDRQRLETILKEFGEDVHADESHLNLAHRVDDLAKNTSSSKYPELVKMRNMGVMMSVIHASNIVEGSDPPRMQILDDSLEALRSLSLDLGFFPEDLLRNKLYEKKQIYLPEAEWEEISNRYSEEIGEVREAVLEACKSRLFQALQMFRSMDLKN